MDEQPFLTRVLTQDDALAAARLHGDCFDQGWPASDLQAHILASSDDVIGGFAQGQLSGFIIMRTQFDQAEIVTIASAPNHRGSGQGKVLLAAGEAAVSARGADIVFLEVAKDNAPALALYRRAGYSQCGIRPGYYRRAALAHQPAGRVDALLLQKRLI